MNYAEITYVTATIANGQTTSAEIEIPGGKTLVGVITPSAFTSTAITFTAATISGGTFVPLYDESTAYSLTVSTSRWHAVKPSAFAGLRYIKLVGGSSEGGDRSLTLVVRNV